MNEDLMLLRTMPWKHRILLILLIIFSIPLCLWEGISFVVGLKYLLLFILLLCASYFDLKSRVIPDWIHIVLIVIGLIDFNATKSFTGLMISPLPFLIMALINAGSIGGGDIKLIGSSGFVLGYGRTTTASMIGIIVAVFFCCLYYLGYKKVGNKRFPFAPFFQVGCMIVVFFEGT